jgi:hypothetical protein
MQLRRLTHHFVTSLAQDHLGRATPATIFPYPSDSGSLGGNKIRELK